MRIVADTNTAVSGLLWFGPPRQILELARQETIHLYTSMTLLAELEDVLGRDKFRGRLQRAHVHLQELVVGYAALTAVVTPAFIEPSVAADPDDDVVLACAVAAQADAIVSGDRHLLDLGQFRNIPILTAPALLSRVAP